MSQSRLQTVHEQMTQWCLDVLSAKDKESGRSLITHQEAAVVRAFLKDNEITEAPLEGTAIAKLREKLAAKRGVLNPELDGLGDGLMQ